MKITFFILFLSFVSYSQNSIKGKIKNSKGELIENVSITIEDVKDNSIVSFAISNEKGEYHLSIDDDSLNFRMIISCIDYQKIKQEITNNSQVLNFTLVETITSLEEVKVDIKAIQQKGDTLTYNISSFEGKDDTTLSDVLKKIPGISVDENGRIKYQGRDINKFYVEGKDLMSGSYGTLTNGLPKGAVTKVQVLEDHQPIKVLKNSVPSNRAAINIKLKKTITLTGSASVGSGFYPFLWNAKITPMLFTKKYQYLFNYKSNNIGEDVISELQSFSFDEGFEGLTFDNLTGYWLNVAQSELPKIESNRYLFNKTQLFSTNGLTTISKNWELKADFSFYNNVIERNGTQFSKIDLFDTNGIFINTISFSRRNLTELENNQIKSKIILTKNTDKSFLKNTIKYQSNWNSVYGNINSDSSIINQNVYSPSYSFQNSLSAISLLGKKIINFKSTLNYIYDKQFYEVSPYSNITLEQFPSIDAEKIKQNIVINTFNLTTEASFILSIKKVSIIPSFGFQIEKIKLNSLAIGKDTSDNTINLGSNFENNLIWNKSLPKLSFAVNFIDDSWNVNVNSPFNFYSLKAIELKNDFSKSLNKLTFEPNFTIKYKISTELSKTFYGSKSINFGTIDNSYSSYIYSALILTQQNSDIQKVLIKKIGGNLEYKLILQNLFINFNYEISNNKSNNTITQNISENGQTIINQVMTDNVSENKRVGFEIGKYIPKLKSKITFGYCISNLLNNILINDSNQNINSIQNAMSLKLNANYFSWLTFDYNINYSISKRNNVNINALTSDLKILIYLSDKQHFGIFKEDYSYEYGNQKFKNQFLDLSYQYTFKKSKIDLELKWTNILNTKNYNELLLNDFSTISNTFLIRPSQILASLRFNFK